MLPDPLPANPDELEALYQEYISNPNADQVELERLIKARLRSWGYDPDHITSEQLLMLMQESMNQLLVNLYGAVNSAPDDGTRTQLMEIIQQAETLRTQVNRVFGEEDGK